MHSAGSALILAVVLTSLLAIVGALFIMVTRIDKMATSAIEDNRNLNLAVDTVVAKICEELILDVPGMPDGTIYQEYHDYPDIENAWLASIEPDSNGGNYTWGQISNITGDGARWFNWPAEIVPDYQPDVQAEMTADADGDGVSDARWFELADMTGSKGQPIYAAIRIIDNGAMLNVNTAYLFDPTSTDRDMDGSSQLQINLMALAGRPSNPPMPGEDMALLDARANYGVDTLPTDLDEYERSVIWRYGEPNGFYTPFDISDELELRNRFLLNNTAIDTRLEEWGGEFRSSTAYTPFGDLDKWFINSYAAGLVDPNYAYRHISTTYNMDKIINPAGGKMVNVNEDVPVDVLYNAIQDGMFDAGVGDTNALNARASQIAVNLQDYRDKDSEVTAIDLNADGIIEYGFDTPCIYISELARVTDANGDYESYAVEFYVPYPKDVKVILPEHQWHLVIDNPEPMEDIDEPLVWPDPLSKQQYHVIMFNDPNAPISTWVFGDSNGITPPDGATAVDPNVVLRWAKDNWATSFDVFIGTDFDDVNNGFAFKGNQTDNFYDPCGTGTLDVNTTYFWRIDEVNVTTQYGDVWSFTTSATGRGSYVAQSASNWSSGEPVFVDSSNVQLHRLAENGDDIIVDSFTVDDAGGAWLGEVYVEPRSVQRDITRHKCIRRLWDDQSRTPTNLGWMNTYLNGDPNYIQAHPENSDFNSIGDITKVFSENAAVITATHDDEAVYIDVTAPAYQWLFNYLTVFDPNLDGIDNDADGYADGLDIGNPEWKIAGRININTAPWYVIAQLPWMTPDIAKAIVGYRDSAEFAGFRNIAKLMHVPEMARHVDVTDSIDMTNFPDLSPDDGAIDDLEERDVIFARISNLITVRSDVFTAYILVRIGEDGPQKRYIAILDRSDVYPAGDGTATGRVKIRALHPVPDPR